MAYHEPKERKPQNERITTYQPTMDLPPLLKLPVELRHLIYSYAIDEQQWFAPDSKQIETLPLGQNRYGQLHFRENLDGTLFQRHKAFLTTHTSDPNKAQLTCAHPISRVNKQFRVEVSEFLRTLSMPIATKVRDFNFSHVQHLLFNLGGVYQDAFKLRHDGSSDRRLTIELQGPYTTSCMENLHRWIEYVDTFVGSERLAELGALYKIIDSDCPKHAANPSMILPLFGHCDDDLHRRIPITVLKDVLEYHGSLAPGGGEIEAHKALRTVYCWLALDWMYKQEHVDILTAVWRRFWS